MDDEKLVLQAIEKDHTELHLHEMDQWNHSDVSPSEDSQSPHISMMGSNQIITDDVRFSIIDAICLKPRIWDCQREKASGATRKDMFDEVAQQINQKFSFSPVMTVEEIEKHWKNLKDTYIKTRKKVTYDHEGCIIPPKWKFYQSMMFLDNLYQQQSPNRTLKRLSDDSLNLSYMSATPKRLRTDDADEMDEYMGFCRSLYFPLREIGYKDRVQLLKAQKAIRDIIHEAQMEAVIGGHIR